MKNKLRYVNESTAVLIFSPVNRRYLTGFNSSLGYLLMTEDGNKLIVDGRYYEAAQKQVVSAEVVLMNNLYDDINAVLKSAGVKKLLIETDNTLGFYQTLKSHLQVKIVPSPNLTEKLLAMRSVKRREEVTSITEAQKIAEKAFCDALDFIKVGVTEKEIAALLEYKMKLYGSDGIAFETIAISGKNTSMPHGVPTDKPIEYGDFVTMDFGAEINGYKSDMTRTVAVGAVTAEMAEVYQTVLDAQENVIKTVKAGATAKEADYAARSVIESKGYGKFFCHSTGHGVGLDIHEKPNLSMTCGDVKLRTGQIVTDEPGIYLPNRFGVRIEDMLLIRKNDCKNLTKAPKHLIIL